jgi:hypothetical protein
MDHFTRSASCFCREKSQWQLANAELCCAEASRGGLLQQIHLKWCLYLLPAANTTTNRSSSSQQVLVPHHGWHDGDPRLDCHRVTGTGMDGGRE